MDQDELIKYLMWIFFLAVALTGLYFALRKMGLFG